jgi:hypothetical protein
MPQKKTAKKKWTLMVYMAGDNNLDGNGVIDLGEMKKVGSNDDITIIAQFDRAGSKGETKRFYLRKGGKLQADTVMKLGETDSGSPQALTDFATWGIKNYPAERYALILWNHGGGWDDTDVYASDRFRSVQRLAHGQIRHAFFFAPLHKTLMAAAKPGLARAVLYDDNAKDFLDNLEMKQVMASIKKSLGHKIDLIGMDACLMSMAEVAYQISGSVRFTVGSEQTEPLDGWPYNTILAQLATKPAMDAKALGAVIVDKYLASYGTNEGVTQAACDLGKSSALATALKNLATALCQGLTNQKMKQAIMQARAQVQIYDVADNIDLTDFCSLVLQQPGLAPEVKTACQKVVDTVAAPQGIVTTSGYKGSAVRNSHGLAIYFPTHNVSPLYAKLDFTKKTGWGKFLEKYLEAVRSR